MNRQIMGNRCKSILVLLAVIGSVVCLSGDIWAANGKISGVVVNKKTKEPLIGCPVQIEGTTLGGLTDIDGRYTILSVPLGEVSVVARMLGYTPIIQSEIQIKPDQTTPVNFELDESEITLDAVRVIGRSDMIQMDQATTKRDVTAEKIKTLPVTNVGDILKTQVGVTVRNDRFHIRGGRSTELLYAVDGVTLSDPLGGRGSTSALNLSGTEIENISIIKGAWSPEYGGTSGIVNISTKEGDRVTRGRLEYFTDNFGTASLNKYSRNYQRMGFNIGGPDPLITSRLLPALGLKSAEDRLSYYLSLNFDREDGAYAWSRYTSPDNPAKYRDIKFLGMVLNERQNNTGEALAKLTFRVSSDIRMTGQYKLSYERNQVWDWNYRYTPNSQDWVEDKNEFYSLKWVHNLGPTTFYEVQYSDVVRDYWDKPGDPNKPGGTLNPDDFLLTSTADSYTDANFNGRWDAPEAWIDVYPDGQFNFGDIFVDRDGNGIYDGKLTPTDTTYDSLIFDFNNNGSYDFGTGEPFVDVNANGTFDTGDILDDRNGNGLYDPDRERNVFDGEAGSGSHPNDNPEPYVDGDISLGEPYVDVNRNGVWDGPGLLPQYPLGEPFDDLSYDGKHQSPSDPWRPGIPFQDLNGNSFFDPGADGSGAWSNRDADYDLGEPYYDLNGDGIRNRADGYFDRGWDYAVTWHERKPRTRTLKADLVSQMRREHEVKLGMSYSAYDFIYNELQQPYVEFAQGFDGGPFQGRGAIRNFYHQTPKTGAFYLVDKMEYGQMVAQVGFRYEYFVQSGNAELTDTLRADTAGVEDYRDKFAPRLAFSYPISDRAKVFFNYGHFYQLPPLHQMYRRSTQAPGVSGTIGNVNLDFVKTIKYEFGVQYLLSAEYLLSVQGFYSDDFGRVSESELQGLSSAETRNFYENSDYSRTRGFEVELDKKYGNYVSGSMTYNLSWAYGKSSAEALDYFDNFYAGTGGKFVIQEFPLDWDERHKVTFILDLRVPANDHPKLFGVTLPDNFGLNIFWQYGSGFPYTPTSSHPGISATLAPGQDPLTNSERVPSTSNVDIRFNKDFRIGPMDYSLEFWVNNLFDTRNIDAVYGDTGRPESGLVQNSVVLSSDREASPTNWTSPRQIRVGLGVNF